MRSWIPKMITIKFIIIMYFKLAQNTQLKANECALIAISVA